MRIGLLLLFFAAAVVSSSHEARAGVICTLAIDPASGETLVREGDCARRMSPASTFKVAIALMGFDTGVLVDEHHPVLPFKQGYPDWRASWRSDTDPAKWMRESVVWYSQQSNLRMGAKTIDRYLTGFGYGNADMTGDPGRDNGLTNSWLASSLQISGDEQAAFLRRLVNRDLGVSDHAYEMTAAITGYGTHGGWLVHGKTGAAAPRLADGSIDRAHAHGWFVGWASRAGRDIVFVRLIQREAVGKEPPGFEARDWILSELLPGLSR